MDDEFIRNAMQGMGMNLGLGMGMRPMGMGSFLNMNDPFAGPIQQLPPMHQQNQQPYNPQMGMPNNTMFNPMNALVPQTFMSPMSMMMMNPFGDLQRMMTASGGNQCYSSSSFTSYSYDDHGKPQVYQTSHEVKSGPDGFKETKSAVRDSRTGTQEMSIGHHIREKAHIIKKSKNALTGEEEEGEELVELDEQEVEQFEQTWNGKASKYSKNSNMSSIKHQQQPRLALTSTAREDDPTHLQCLSSPGASKSIKKEKKRKEKKTSCKRKE